MNTKQNEQAEAVRKLREILKPGDTVYINIGYISHTGLSRVFAIFIIRANIPICIEWETGRALGYSLSRHEGIGQCGYGVDPGFQLVYALSSALFPEGFGCIGDGCPSSCHR